MAAAAETLEIQTSEFDWELAELQFSEAGYTQQPEYEIYGRSLSTARRLGALMIGKTAPEIVESPEAAQVKAEFFTSVEEGFGTDMELGGGLEVRDFDTRPIVNGRVVAKDNKTPISTMTAAGLKCAEEKVLHDTQFAPQLTRSKWDHENALIVDKMSQGKMSYNTRIVISPFPVEAAAQSGDAYWRNIGYVPHLRRGFVQLYHANGEEIMSGSLSFDGSNKQQLRNLFSRFGVEIPEDEITDNWLKYAITGNFTEAEAKEMATSIADAAGDPMYKKSTNTVDVSQEFKSVMERVYNESYVHICESLKRRRQTSDVKVLVSQLANQAENLNQRYAEALHDIKLNMNRFTADDFIVLHDLLVYSTIEMMRALHLQEKSLPPDRTNRGQQSTYISVDFLRSADPASFQNILGGFGREGAKNNRIYSACGLQLSLGDISGDANGPQTVFGGIDKLISGNDHYGSRKFRCKNGHWNERPFGKLISHCRHCGTSVACGKDTNIINTSPEKRKKITKIKAEADRSDRQIEAEVKVEEAFRESGWSF